MKFFIPISLAVIILLVGCNNTKKKESDELITKEVLAAKLDSIGSYFLNAGKVQGVSVAVRTARGVLYNKGFGYIDSPGTVPVQNNHIFLMASISKLIGATVVMRLVEEGKFTLDDTLLDLLPDYPSPEQGRKITMYHLISHTSGLQDYAMDIDPVYLESGRHPTRSDYFRFFETHELLFEPGRFYSYSNSGFVLMAMIIEQVTGRTLQDEVDRIINRPSGLDIRLIAERLEDPYLSNYFEWADSTIINRCHWPWIKGDGGLTATAGELAKFPFRWSNGSIISKASFDTMSTPSVLTNGIQTGYGLGVRTGNFEGERVIGHTGGNKSGFAMMMFFPERKISIVVMVNTDNTPADAITIMGPVALAVLDKETPRQEEREVKDVDLSVYEGTYLKHEYKESSFDTLVVYANPEDNHLYMKYKNRDSKGLKYYYMGDHSFAYDSYPMDRTVFELDDDGEVVAFRNYWNGLFQRMGFRKEIFGSGNE